MSARTSAVGLNRRGFLRLSASTAAALTSVNVVLLSGCSGHYRKLAAGRRPLFFSLKEFAVLSGLLGHIIPEREGSPSVDDARLAERMDLEMTFHASEAVAGDIRLALTVLEYGPLFRGRFSRFTSMAADRQLSFLESVINDPASSLLRQALGGVKMLAMVLYYSDDRSWQKIGYRGPFVERKLPEASNALASLAANSQSGRS